MSVYVVSGIVKFARNFYRHYVLLRKITFTKELEKRIFGTEFYKTGGIHARIACEIADSPELFVIAKRATSIKVEGMEIEFMPGKPHPVFSSALVVFRNDKETTYREISLK